MTIYQSSIAGFFSTLLIIIAIYWIFKFFIKLVAPYLLVKAVKKMEKKMHSQQQTYQQQTYQQQYNNTSEKDYDISEQLKQNKIPKEKKKVGEYIDYEEL